MSFHLYISGKGKNKNLIFPSYQCVWFQEVFPLELNVVDNMLEILLDVYSNLDPKMDFCIEAGLKQNQSNPLDYLIQLKQLFNQHLAKLVDILTKGKQGTTSNLISRIASSL